MKGTEAYDPAIGAPRSWQPRVWAGGAVIAPRSMSLLGYTFPHSAVARANVNRHGHWMLGEIPIASSPAQVTCPAWVMALVSATQPLMSAMLARPQQYHVLNRMCLSAVLFTLYDAV